MLTYEEYLAWARAAEAAVPHILPGFASNAVEFSHVVIEFLPKIDAKMREPARQAKWQSMGIPIIPRMMAGAVPSARPPSAPPPSAPAPHTMDIPEATALMRELYGRFRLQQAA
jgi:hypothetical protein